jgi:hypothetical protein
LQYGELFAVVHDVPQCHQSIARVACSSLRAIDNRQMLAMG